MSDVFEAAQKGLGAATQSAAKEAAKGGLLSSLGKFAGPMEWGFMLGSMWMDARQQDRAERKRLREAARQASMDPRQIDAGARVSKHYGYVKFPALFFYGARNDDVPLIVADHGTLDPTDPGTDWLEGQAGAKQMRLEQFALQVGECDIDNILVNGLTLNHETLRGLVCAEINGPGEPSEMAKAFTAGARSVRGGTVTVHGTGTNQRDDNSRGDRITMMTLAVHHRPSRLNITGTPTVEPFGRGARVRKIQSDGSLGDPEFSTSLSDHLLDFFLDTDVGLAADFDMDIDADLWRTRGQVRSERRVQGPGNVAGSDMAGTDNPLDTPSQTLAQRRAALGLDEDWSGYAPSPNFGSATTTGEGPPQSVIDRARAAQVPRYTSSGGVGLDDSAEEYIVNQLRNAPGAVLAQTDEGKWYLDLPDSITDEATQSVATVTDEDLYGGYFEIVPPNADTLVTQVVADFIDIDNGQNPSRVIYPKPGSAGARQLEERFGGVYQLRIHLRAGTDRAHVETICRSLILESFRPLWKFPMHVDDLSAIAGDVVTCQSRFHNRNAHVRIMRRIRRSGTGRLHVDFTGREFDKDDYDLVTEAEATFEIIPDWNPLPRAETHPGRTGGGPVLLYDDLGNTGNPGGYRFFFDDPDNPGELIGMTTGNFDTIRNLARMVRIGSLDQDGRDTWFKLNARQVGEVLRWNPGGADPHCWAEWIVTRIEQVQGRSFDFYLDYLSHDAGDTPNKNVDIAGDTPVKLVFNGGERYRPGLPAFRPIPYSDIGNRRNRGGYQFRVEDRDNPGTIVGTGGSFRVISQDAVELDVGNMDADGNDQTELLAGRQVGELIGWILGNDRWIAWTITSSTEVSGGRRFGIEHYDLDTTGIAEPVSVEADTPVHIGFVVDSQDGTSAGFKYRNADSRPTAPSDTSRLPVAADGWYDSFGEAQAAGNRGTFKWQLNWYQNEARDGYRFEVALFEPVIDNEPLLIAFP